MTHHRWHSAQPSRSPWRRPRRAAVLLIGCAAIFLPLTFIGLSMNDAFRRLINRPRAATNVAAIDPVIHGGFFFQRADGTYSLDGEAGDDFTSSAGVIIFTINPMERTGPIAPLFDVTPYRLVVTPHDPNAMSAAEVQRVRDAFIDDLRSRTGLTVPDAMRHQVHHRARAWRISGVLHNVIILLSGVGLLFLATTFLASARRARRWRRGRCPACAYPLPPSARCPECGWTPPTADR